MSTPQQSNGHYPQGQQPNERIVYAERQPEKKKGGCMKWGLIILGVLVLPAIISAIMSGDDSSSEGTAGDSATTTTAETAAGAVPAEQPAEEQVPAEHRNALRQADIYANTLHMSERGLYEQLTSEYGGQFSAEAAQYAVDTIDADWDENALEQARTYLNDLAMSPAAVYDQLISEYGGKFTPEQAQYAVDNL